MLKRVNPSLNPSVNHFRSFHNTFHLGERLHQTLKSHFNRRKKTVSHNSKMPSNLNKKNKKYKSSCKTCAYLHFLVLTQRISHAFTLLYICGQPYIASISLTNAQQRKCLALRNQQRAYSRKKILRTI